MSHAIEGLSLSGKSKILLGKGTEAIYKSPPEQGQGIVITQKGNKRQICSNTIDAISLVELAKGFW
jgi:hypothetical protein